MELPLTPPPLSGLQKTHLLRMVETLQNMGVRFAILEPDGTAHGNGTLAVVKTRTRVGSILQHGLMKNYVEPQLENMRPGDSRVIRCPDFFPAEWPPMQRVRHLQRSITSYCSVHWERGTYMSASDQAGDAVEVVKTEIAPNE